MPRWVGIGRSTIRQLLEKPGRDLRIDAAENLVATPDQGWRCQLGAGATRAYAFREFLMVRLHVFEHFRLRWTAALVAAEGLIVSVVNQQKARQRRHRGGVLDTGQGGNLRDCSYPSTQIDRVETFRLQVAHHDTERVETAFLDRV